jgi:hypothetical protein
VECLHLPRWEKGIKATAKSSEFSQFGLLGW